MKPSLFSVMIAPKQIRNEQNFEIMNLKKNTSQ